MSRAKPPNPDFLNGIPELLVLQLLARRPMHGYGVVQAVRSASGEQFDFGEGCIYPVLHRLERAGMLASTKEPAGKRTRIVYRVTAAGLARLERSAAVWADVVRAVNRVLQGGGDAEPALPGSSRRRWSSSCSGGCTGGAGGRGVVQNQPEVSAAGRGGVPSGEVATASSRPSAP